MTTAPIDLAHLRQWVGRSEVRHDVAAPGHARLMAATVARPGPELDRGDALPPLWHWTYFLEGLPPAQLGRDGHPARGGFLPPVPLSNRMWAGGRVSFAAPVPLGAAMQKRSTVLRVDHKTGRSGELVFVTVRHEILVDGLTCIDEEHDIVYKSAGPSAPAAAAAQPAEPAAPVRRELCPDSTQLFRYSALTFNGHRIHYDADYCRSVEGYDNLVVHGPLVATLLAGLAQELAGAALTRFEYRALSPVLLGQGLTLNAWPQAGRVSLHASVGDGRVSMRAEAWHA